MKKIYDPDPEDVIEWAKSELDEWPASDWDYYVMNGKNDNLVFELADNKKHAKFYFFLHSLYYLVGDYFNEKNKNLKKEERINNLLAKVNELSSTHIKEWMMNTQDLFNGKLNFDPEFWLNYMFYDDIKKLKNKKIDSRSR